MVKNLPTIERSTKIRFGKQAPINQADNTIVLNASSTAINAPTGDSIYMSPLRVTNPASTTVIGYNPTTKELYNTNVLTSAIGSGGGGGGNITLGTGTTGDYISTITGGNGITSTGATTGETIAHTLSVDAKTNGGLVIESNQLAVDLSASAITGTLAVGNGGTGATTLTSGKIPYIKSDNTFGDSEMSYNDVTDVTSLSSNLTVTGTTTSNVVLAGGYVNESTAQYFTVTAVTGLFIVDGVNQPVLTLYRGVTYRFDYSDSSNTSHPLRISTTAEGEQYNTGYSSFGNRGTAGAYIQFIVPMEAPDTMYYNCGAHPGMGNTINIISPSLTSSVSTVSSNVFIGNHVGIGTSSPSYPLDVTGNMNVTGGLRVNDSTGTSGEVLTSSGGGVMSWGSVGTAQGGTGVTTGLAHLDAGNITSGTLAVGRGGTGATTLDNLITLGSHTTGNYVQSISGGNGITSTGATSGETIAHTLSVDTKEDGGLVIESNQLAVDLNASDITGTLAVGDGGTNIPSYTTGDIIYANGNTSLTKLGIGNAGEVLTVSGGNPSWAAASASSPWTTSGNDIVYNTGEVIIGSYISYDGPPGDVSKFGFPQNNTFTITTNNTERLRIDSSGDVGIGTTNPGYKLDVNGTMHMGSALYVGAPSPSAGTNGQVLTSSGGGAMSWTTPSSGGGFSGDIADYITHTGDSNTKFGFPSNDTFTITTNNTERLRIDSGGEVSIGSDTDIGSGHKMTIVGGSTSSDSSYADLVVTNLNEHNNARILLGTPYNTDSNSGFKAAIIADGAGSSSRCDLHFCLENSSSNTPTADLSDSKMMIKYATGNVGIGTTSPSYKLDVSGTGRFTSSLSASSFSGSGYSLTGLQAGNISSGTLSVSRGGTNISSYTTGDIIYANSSTSLTKLGIGSTGEVLTVAGGNPSWAAASGGGGGGGGATAGTVTVGDDGMSAINVSGSAYDYMYHQTPHNIASSSSNFNSISISQAMTHGQKLIMKLYTSSTSCQAKIARGRDLSVTIDGSNHTVSNSNFREHTLSFPYDSDPTTSKFLILEITKEDSNKVSIEAKLSTAEFTKSAECDGSWSYDGVDTFNRETAIHNVIYGGLRSMYGSQLKFRFSYFGIGHSHDIYFQQDDPSGLSVAASQIEFYYNNSSSSWSQASQTNVFTNFDKSTNLEFAHNKYYHIHHEVIRASSDDYPSEILFTVEELNAASGGGGGGGGGGGSDFTTNITLVNSNPPTWREGIEIDAAFSAANYNYNTGFYNFNNSSWPPFDTFIIDHTLPTSMPIEYDFHFTGYSNIISASLFKVYYNGYQQNTYHSFPGSSGQTSYNFQQGYTYSVTFKALDASGNDWTAVWKEYRN